MNAQPDFSRLMQGVIPYLEVESTDTALAFYRKAFGAVQHGETVKDDRGVAMNAGLEINGGFLMLMDRMPQGDGRPASTAVTGVTMQLVVPDGDRWWSRAVEAGCEVTMPFAPQFWGDRYGRLRDPFGVDWAINEPAPNRKEMTS